MSKKQLLINDNSRLLITSILIFILTIPWIVLVTKVALNFDTYGSGVNSQNPYLPLAVQLERFWLLIISTSLGMLITYSLILSYRINKFFMLTLGFFSWVLWGHLYMRSREEWRMRSYYIYEDFNYVMNPSISFASLVEDWKNFKFSKISRNTMFYIFVLAIFAVGFIEIIIPNADNKFYFATYWSHRIFGYFTNTTNILCFIFLVMFPFVNSKQFNHDNSKHINLCAYITIVALIYWCLLFPQKIINGTFDAYGMRHQFNSIWLHAVTPLFFIIFGITCASNNLTRPENSWLTHTSRSLVYPLWYGLYTYATPFLVKYSVYGKFTNLNPDGWVFKNDNSLQFEQNGAIWVIVIPVAIALAICALVMIYRWLFTRVISNNLLFDNKQRGLWN